ncbi:hypothetical protein FIBSPDRAFT_849927, partial [Athelia psychrophila]
MQVEAARTVSTPSPKHAPRDIRQPIVTQLVLHMAPNPADIRISQGTIQLEKSSITGRCQWRKMRPTSSSRMG